VKQIRQLKRVSVMHQIYFRAKRLTATKREARQPKLRANQSGFSVIEILVVGAIMGILALIAVPQFSMYRERGYNTSASNDLRNVAAAQEAYFAQNAKYLAIQNCSNTAADANCQVSGLPGVTTLSKGIKLSIETSPSGFKGEARHAKSNKVCRWDSAQGGMLGCS
jgi:prepilin-type N-terminal cleavage/methylation domain-containing protein